MSPTRRSAPPPEIPYDPLTEATVVGNAILTPSTIDEAIDEGLEAQDFHDPTHRALWEAIVTVNFRDGARVDTGSIASELAPEILDRAGGVPGLQALQTAVPSSKGTVDRVRRLHAFTERRRAIDLSYQLRDAARTGTDWRTVAQRLNQLGARRADQPNHLDLRWVDQVHLDPPPEPATLVDGFIRAGELSVIVAPRKLGKSWVGMQLAILLAQGEGHLFGTLPIRQQCRVLIAQGELDEWGTYDRWNYLCSRDRVPGGKPPGIAESFDRWKIRTEEYAESWQQEGRTYRRKFTEAVLDRRIEPTIVANGIDVLVIDPWAVFYAGSENSNDETEAALGELRELSRRTDVAIVIIHHISKAGEVREPEDLWRGAGRLADWASTGLTMMPHYLKKGEAEKAGLDRKTARRYADLYFMRRHKPTDDFSIALDPTNGWWDRWEPAAKPVAPRAAQTEGRSFNPPDVAAALAAAGGRWGSLREATASLGVSPDTTRRVVEAAVASGHIIPTDGKKAGAKGYTLPDQAPPTLGFDRFDDGTSADDLEAYHHEHGGDIHLDLDDPLGPDDDQ